MIVPLSIQPIVENAIRHGIYERGAKGGTVSISAYRNDAQWENLYNVTYVVAEDPVYGSPADAPVPAQKTDIVYNTTVTLEADLTTDWNTSTGKDDAGVPGTWSFTGWSTDTTYADDLTEKVILKDETVYGKWVFTPNAYTVTYVVNGDPTYGTPADGTAPTDESNPYDYKEQVTVKADLVTA